MKPPLLRMTILIPEPEGQTKGPAHLRRGGRPIRKRCCSTRQAAIGGAVLLRLGILAAEAQRDEGATRSLDRHSAGQLQ